MDGGAWWATVHGVTKSQTQLSDFTFTFHFHALEKEMATHSSILAWRIPGTEEPVGLPSMGSHRVRHDCHDRSSSSHFTKLFNDTVSLEDTHFHKGQLAAAAKPLQLCLTLRNPIDGSPPGSPVPGILQARTLEWVAISFSNT